MFATGHLWFWRFIPWFAGHRLISNHGINKSPKRGRGFFFEWRDGDKSLNMGIFWLLNGFGIWFKQWRLALDSTKVRWYNGEIIERTRETNKPECRSCEWNVAATTTSAETAETAVVTGCEPPQHGPRHDSHSTHAPHLTLHTQNFKNITLYPWDSTLHTLHSTLDTLHLTSHTHTLRFALCTVHFTLQTLHCTFYILHFTLYTLHDTSKVLRLPRKTALQLENEGFAASP